MRRRKRRSRRARRDCSSFAVWRLAYGLAGAPCAALIADPELIVRLAAFSEPLPTPTVRLAESVLDASRTSATERRIAEVKAERARVAAGLSGAVGVAKAVAAEGPFVIVTPRDADAARADIRSFSVPGAWRSDGAFRLDVRDADANNRALAAFGAGTQCRFARGAAKLCARRWRRVSSCRSILMRDRRRKSPLASAIYDHMLQQVATHGGFSLALTLRWRSGSRRAPHDRGLRAGAGRGVEAGARREARHRAVWLCAADGRGGGESVRRSRRAPLSGV